MSDRRVVITGVGMISPVGNSPDEFWQAVCEGRSGIGPITQFDASQYDARIAGEVDNFDPTDWIDRKLVKRCDRFVQFALAATEMALSDARLQITEENRNRVGVLIGSGIGGMHTWEEQHKILLTRGPSRVSPFLVPKMIIDMASGMVSMQTGARGPNSAIATACASAGHAIGEAAVTIRRGAAEIMITGGAEATISPTAMAGFTSAKALSTRNDDPQRSCRPFDRDRDGFVVGEGSTILILEELEHAQGRGAPIWGELMGYGASADAWHVTAPDPEGVGACLAMEAALDDAGLQPADIDYVNAHAPGTPNGDAMEAKALAATFTDSVPISSTKPIHAHQLGATSATELVACMLAMRDSLIPYTVNCDNLDESVPQHLDIVRGEPRTANVDVAMSNSFGFGGHNAVLIVSRFG